MVSGVKHVPGRDRLVPCPPGVGSFRDTSYGRDVSKSVSHGSPIRIASGRPMLRVSPPAWKGQAGTSGGMG
jgi:hypothetical protein